MKTITAYTKTFAELSDDERKSFLSLSEPDGDILALIEGVKNEESVNIEVAFTKDGTAIDYRVFDPFHQYTKVYTCADGWTNWLFDNYEEEQQKNE